MSEVFMNIKLKNFWNLGVADTMPSYLQAKVRISNYVAVALMGAAIAYWLISAIYNPELNFIPILGVFLVAASVVMNYFSFTTVSRTMMSMLPVSLAIAYQAYLVPAGGEPLVGLMVLTLGFSTVSFALFDLREGVYIFIPIAYAFLLMVMFPFVGDALEMSLDHNVYRHGVLYTASVAIGFMLSLLNVLVLAFMNLKSDKKSQELLKTAAAQNRVLEEKEKVMQENLAALQLAQEEEKRRSWASEGFSRFGAILRRQDNEQQMYDALLGGIIKYIEANQGGLYLAEGEGKQVELVLRSSYAYDRKKFKEHRVEPGQGLLGQCYLERDHIYLTRIPQNYVFVTSGLGDATPSALLLIPLLTEDEVMGVLEVASFRPFPQHIIDFLMKMGQDIAATVNIGRTNQLTRRLLEQAQEQTEQMRAQEEEMRQNMEELAATQEELQRKEREYMRQIDRLQQQMQEQPFDDLN